MLASIIRYDSQYFSSGSFTSGPYEQQVTADSGIDRYDGIFAATQALSVTFGTDGETVSDYSRRRVSLIESKLSVKIRRYF